MYRGNDSVFRFSLIGIAFIFIFFLLIVFSRMYTDTSMVRTETLVRLDQQQEGALPLAQQEAFEVARQELQDQLSEEGINANEVIRALLDKAKMETELATAKKRIQELGAQLMGLNEARKVLTQTSRTPVLDGTSAELLVSALELHARLEQEFLSTTPSADKLTDSEIISRALAAVYFKRNIETLVERELGLPLVPGQDPAWEQWLLTDSQSFKSLLAESATSRAIGGGSASRATDGGNSALRAQIAFLRARLEGHGDRATPPCWFDSAGRAQLLLSIELSLPRSGSTNINNVNVTVKPAWPPGRENSARAIPGIKQINSNQPYTYANFKEELAHNIAQHGGQQCRYSVQVSDKLRRGMLSEKIHKDLETFFHLAGSG
ncbi:MAG: hypothetical protein FWG26_04305 [Betaproteobacteria bacterium]|jgi:small-conductance mechanosensitive channel|nr:hypothetical protein [Betaproteobacteria bacterium]